MSRGVPQSPAVTRSGTTKIAAPRPVKTASVPMPPICSQFSGVQTAVPPIVGSQ